MNHVFSIGLLMVLVSIVLIVLHIKHKNGKITVNMSVPSGSGWFQREDGDFGYFNKYGALLWGSFDGDWICGSPINLSTYLTRHYTKMTDGEVEAELSFIATSMGLGVGDKYRPKVGAAAGLEWEIEWHKFHLINNRDADCNIGMYFNSGWILHDGIWANAVAD